MSLHFRSVATTIPPDKPAVDATRLALNDLALANAVPRTATTRLQIVLDELVSNILRHGFAHNPDIAGLIKVLMSVDGETFKMQIRDPAPQFDPTQARYAVDEERPSIGGRGLDMVHALIDTATHQWIDNTNLTIVTKKINRLTTEDPTMIPGLTIDEERGNGAVTVHLRGRIDSGNASQLTEHLKGLAKGGYAEMTLDMAGLEYLTSAGFRTMLVATDAAEEAGGGLALCNLSEEVRELFDLCGLSSAFRIS